MKMSFKAYLEGHFHFVDRDATRGGFRSVFPGMRYKTKFASAGFIFLAVSACANPQATPRPAGQGVPISSPQAQPLAGNLPGPGMGHPVAPAPDGSVEIPAGQLDATALPAGFPHEVYTGKDGKVISVKAEEGGCGRAIATPVEQSAQRVVIDLSETPGQPGQMCTMDIRYPVVSVTLDAPLGNRTVVLHKEQRNR
jgi:hypothetical protein